MNHASLFSGIGGAEVAASMMGWQNLFHCEIQEFPRKVLDYWFPNSESYEDITKTDFRKWKGKIDVLTGGFPCQPFSLAGRRKGKDDYRYLWPQMLRAIREIQPTWVIAENVIGIKTMVEPGQEIKMGRTDDLFEENYLYRKESRFTLEKICQDLEAAGYSVQPINIPACSVGAPHRRERIWIIAHRSDPRAETMQQKRKDRVLSAGSPTYSHRSGQRNRQNQQKPFNRCKSTANLGALRKKRTIANSLRLRSNQVHQKVQFQVADGTKPYSIGMQRNGSNSINKEENYWKEFPTQSPVCRGNDGIPFDVDHLTISFPRWRQESIKAYGNAWVPQVAYEIFRAIEAETT
ncbi:MAG: DNA (cytosine-5-)-methyltransferase [Prevotella sp.]|nr:DNA (cytosine-5-)-methyltransferase [Prevotella sp.]